MSQRPRPLSLSRIFLGGFLVGILTILFAPWVKCYSARSFSKLGIPGTPQAFRILLSNDSVGGVGLYFFDNKNIDRLAFGAFPGGRLSCIGLSQRGNAVNPLLFLRLEGSNQNPMLFLKNHQDVHRLDMGLDIHRPDEDPYLVYWDAKGKKQAVFGEFPYLP